VQYALIFVLLLSFVFGLGLIARRLDIPYPILFVIGGLAIGMIPILPYKLVLDPNLVFFVFLPPLLYIQAFFTSWRDFRTFLRPILLLAVGLVLVTTITVAYVAHWIIPNVDGTGTLPLAVGFVLGAIVSPPDAIAASAIAQRLGLPRRVVTILEGESLVNDATSLVLFKVALAAVGATVPLLGKAWLPGEFIYVSVGGLAVGLAVARVVAWIRPRLKEAGTQINLCMSLMTPYISYLLADQFLHVSGVLATIATGMYLGWQAPEVYRADVRLQAQAFWQTIIYLLNGIVFVLIGLQLPTILGSMDEPWWPRPFFQAVVINLVCIVVRIAWIFPGAYLPRLSKRVRETEDPPDWRQVAVMSWCGMRGVVSLAAALTLLGYANFPRPHLVAFIAFSVILTTLVLQGLTLPPLIRWLGVGDDGIPAREEAEARQQLARAVYERIEKVRKEGNFPAKAIDRVEDIYREQESEFHDDLADQIGWSDQRHHFLSVRRLNRLMIVVRRRALLKLHRADKIGDDVLHKIEHELDLEEDRLGL
jgi:CPA1 family monovalent cation:H+ antiporter